MMLVHLYKLQTPPAPLRGRDALRTFSLPPVRSTERDTSLRNVAHGTGRGRLARVIGGNGTREKSSEGVRRERAA